MTHFGLIIFDECHNAKGNHQYNRLLSLYMDEKIESDSSCKGVPQVRTSAVTSRAGISHKTMFVGVVPFHY